jgi:hypothetical protein
VVFFALEEAAIAGFFFLFSAPMPRQMHPFYGFLVRRGYS